jgi:hypothetical protein
MSTQKAVYWPFPVLPPEQLTLQHRQEIEFLEAAYRAGLRPCKFEDGEYRIGSDEGRSAWVIARGRRGVLRRWEVWLNDGGERVSSQTVEGFDAAAAVAMGWMLERDLDEATAAVLSATEAMFE